MASRYVVEHLNHLGIVAEVCRETGVAAWLDQQEPGNRQHVSVGTAADAAIPGERRDAGRLCRRQWPLQHGAHEDAEPGRGALGQSGARNVHRRRSSSVGLNGWSIIKAAGLGLINEWSLRRRFLRTRERSALGYNSWCLRGAEGDPAAPSPPCRSRLQLRRMVW